MYSLKDKNILVVGFGRSGQAAVRYCAAQGARVAVTDGRPESEFANVLPSFAALNLKTYFGGHPDACFDAADVIVLSPGVPDLPQVVVARKRGIPVVGELELATHEVTAPIIAITGTNGKTTTTALIGHLLNEGGLTACVGGNIGTPLLDLLPQAKSAKVIVLEVSSYQLETAPSFHPHVAVLLNITPDHLDRYGDMEHYIAAKALIFKNQTPDDICIYNIGDSGVLKLASAATARKVPFSTQHPTVRYRIEDTQLTGEHNFENMIAAVLAVQAVGLPDAAIERGLKTFKGLPHRLQFVCEVGGVSYYDDSKGTNIGAVVKSLAGFSQPVHLIAGGMGKGTRYTDLRPSIAEHVHTLILMGADRDIMREDLGDLATTVLVDSMKEAVKVAFESAHAGDVVLLSPACASFDMFKDYADRGNQFATCVRELAA